MEYIKLVIMFFASSWLINYALNFNISVPLQMIFRSGSLMANMVLGIFILQKSYDIFKYLSVVMISVGIFICTLASGSEMKKKSEGNDDDGSFVYWMMGVGMLAAALFISARMGLYQEVLYKKHGKHSTEALFYTHSMSLPFFLLMFPNICHHFFSALHSPAVPLPIFNFAIPILLIYLVGNFLAHFLCVSCVYRLTAETSSLTVTLVITLRKFTSLLYSILYFQHDFTALHWLGTLLIIIGTVIFTEIIPKMREKIVENQVGMENEPLINATGNEEFLSYKKKFRKFFKQSMSKIELAELHSETNKAYLNDKFENGGLKE